MHAKLLRLILSYSFKTILPAYLAFNSLLTIVFNYVVTVRSVTMYESF